AIADGYTVGQYKPEPDVFLWVTTALGINPTEAVVFEDAQAGIDAARKANMFVIGVGNPALVRGADWIVPTLEGLHLQDILAARAARPY
ncbi:MAG: beta-phosphoglucomutase, partial [Chloroflexi bacterium]